jgi:ribulose-phosphate 3-epimerase
MSHQIIPAIIAQNWHELEEKINMFKGISEMVHLDVMNGTFTKQTSWPYKKQDNYFEEIQKEERGMPCWEDVDFEVHLMIKNPEDVIQEWLVAGAKRILIHPESTNNLADIIEQFKDLVEIGLVISLDTDFESLKEYFSSIDTIQCMSISHIGAHGEPFNPNVLKKIEEIKKLFPEIVISVDGGINLQNIDEVLNAGADRCVVGSAIFESDNYVETIHNLSNS